MSSSSSDQYLLEVMLENESEFIRKIGEEKRGEDKRPAPLVVPATGNPAKDSAMVRALYETRVYPKPGA